MVYLVMAAIRLKVYKIQIDQYTTEKLDST